MLYRYNKIFILSVDTIMKHFVFHKEMHYVEKCINVERNTLLFCLINA